MTVAPPPAMAEPMPGVRRQPSPAVALMSTMLRRSLAFGHVGWIIAISIGFWLDDLVGVANAAIGGGVVVFFYAAGQGTQMLAGELDPQSGMALTVLSFVTRVTLLGLLWVGVNSSPSIEAAFRPMIFFGALMLVLVGWLAGMFVAWSQMRVPVYDQDWDPRPASPRTRASKKGARRSARARDDEQEGR